MLSKIIVFISGLLVTYSVTASTLADRHVSRNVACAQCHQEGKSAEEVKTQACLTCHGPYSALVKKTSKSDINPHDTHVGEVGCDSCHSAHGKPKLICTQCHGTAFNEDLKTP